MKTTIGISDESRQKVATVLSELLADESILYIKTKNAHWNVVGADFHEKHIFFEGQMNQLNGLIDRVAERIRTIGHFAPATMHSYLSLTHLTEVNQFDNSSIGFVKALLSDHESIVIQLREHIAPFANDFHDAGTSDFITWIMKEHEQMAWFLRSHIK
ncbi:MAG: DNA starvation/stationary phase protection protein [Flavobacteriales bacterium]|nr:DNA starvation/stationary phase protection protein [Flavobacteriales bacterium]